MHSRRPDAFLAAADRSTAQMIVSRGASVKGISALQDPKDQDDDEHDHDEADDADPRPECKHFQGVPPLS
jgi:hypothetical protein